MADYVLSARIVAEVDNFDRNMRTVTRQAQTTSRSVDGLTSSVNRNGQSFNRVVPAANAAGAAMARAGQQVNRSRNNYTELGRVLQDLPFGFVGIQNNLTQLVPAAGLAGLAFSALVSAITFAQVGTSAWTRGLGDNKKAIDEAKKALDDYRESLTGVASAHLEGSRNAQQELITLKTLYSIATNISISYKQRKDAVDEIQKQYPAYFKNLSDESIMVGDQVKVYQSLAKVILATARAEASRGKIVENTKEVLTYEQQMQDLQAERVRIWDKTERAIRKGVAAQNALYTEAQKEWRMTDAQLENRVKQIATMDAIKDIDEQIFKLAAGRNKLNDENLNLTKNINAEVKKGADLTGKIGDLAVEKTKKILALLKGARNMEIAPTLLPFVQDTKGRSIANKGRTDKIGLATSSQITGAGDYLSAEQQRILESQMKFNEDMSNLISSGLSNSLMGIGESIGTALAEGGNVFEAVGKGLLSSLGDILSQMGQAAIKIGIGLGAIKTALKSLNPAVAIAAGVGLVALGAFFKSKMAATGGSMDRGGQTTAFANGGIVSGPTRALVGEYSGARNNPEVISPLNKLNSYISGSIKRALSEGVNTPYDSFSKLSSASIGKLAGSFQPIMIAGEFMLRGENLVASAKRTETRLNRQ